MGANVIIGLGMPAALFVAIFLLAWRSAGIRSAISAYLTAFAVAGWISVSAFMVCGK